MQACQKFRGVVIDASTARCGQWEQVCFWFRTQPDLCPEFAKTEVDLPKDALRRTRGGQYTTRSCKSLQAEFRAKLAEIPSTFQRRFLEW
jgi:hypothetical protein